MRRFIAPTPRARSPRSPTTPTEKDCLPARLSAPRVARSPLVFNEDLFAAESVSATPHPSLGLPSATQWPAPEQPEQTWYSSTPATVPSQWQVHDDLQLRPPTHMANEACERRSAYEGPVRPTAYEPICLDLSPSPPPAKKPRRAVASQAPQKQSRVSKASKKAADNSASAPPQGQPMRWTIALAALALETRYKDRAIYDAFEEKNKDGKKIKELWEKTALKFSERALRERAWGDREPQLVSVKQYKNKLNAIQKLFRAKRMRLVATGNRADVSDSDGAEASGRYYKEMPGDFFVDGYSDEEDEAPKRACDPDAIQDRYQNLLGKEMAALWPLLCDIGKNRPGFTGEALAESGGVSIVPEYPADEACEESESSGSGDSEDECSDTPSVARAKAKAAAKGSKNKRSGSRRPVDVVDGAIRAGFETIERVFAVRRPSSETSTDLETLVKTLATTVQTLSSNQTVIDNKQRDDSRVFLQSIQDLQASSRVTAELLTELVKQVKRD